MRLDPQEGEAVFPVEAVERLQEHADELRLAAMVVAHRLECPRILYTDLDGSLCKVFGETLLMGMEPSSRTL